MNVKSFVTNQTELPDNNAMDPSRISRRFKYLVYLLRLGHRGRYPAQNYANQPNQNVDRNSNILRVVVGMLLSGI